MEVCQGAVTAQRIPWNITVTAQSIPWNILVPVRAVQRISWNITVTVQRIPWKITITVFRTLFIAIDCFSKVQLSFFHRLFPHKLFWKFSVWQVSQNKKGNQILLGAILTKLNVLVGWENHLQNVRENCKLMAQNSHSSTTYCTVIFKGNKV